MNPRSRRSSLCTTDVTSSLLLFFYSWRSFPGVSAQGSFHHPASKKVAVTVEFDGGNRLPAVELHTWHLHVLLDLLKVSLNPCNLCWFHTKLRIQELELVFECFHQMSCNKISVLIGGNQWGTPTSITRLICIPNQSEESLRSQEKKQETVLVLKVPNSKGANCFLQNSQCVQNVQKVKDLKEFCEHKTFLSRRKTKTLIPVYLH